MKDWIAAEIAAFIATYARERGVATAWRQPLVAYADARDALFPRLRQVASPSHATPQALLPGARTVIAMFVPFAESVARSNQRGPLASEAWARAYVETNALVLALSEHLARALGQRGFRSALTPPTHNFSPDTLTSDWSHKHVAAIAGLGHFGLHSMLITAQGCAGRLGSLVTEACTEPTPRSDAEACLHKAGQRCSACVRRCPSAALSLAGLDRQRCYARCLENADHHRGPALADVCGLCACGVPCSLLDPVAARSHEPSAPGA
jgi:epoxyqueuosine reductase QueG